ncbi:hypothetical protein [Asticcacaulis sp.]|uniref:hypothetical protein n=1 Tax=Asticcacaulis sp. TaxID=1872648 RepID=UPI00391AEFF3
MHTTPSYPSPSATQPFPPAVAPGLSGTAPDAGEAPPFGRRAILLWSQLCERIILNKSTAQALRRVARLSAGEMALPPGHGSQSPYRALLNAAKHLSEDDLSRQRLIDLAHLVGNDLIRSCPDSFETSSTLPHLLHRRVSEPAPKASRFAARVNGYVREDDEPAPQLGYRYRAEMARMANDDDEATETERALRGGH